MTSKDPWDVLAPSTPYAVSEPTEWYDADNIILAEPVMMQYLTSQIPSSRDKLILDFGCGSGKFAGRLQKLGYKVEGVDTSSNMIKAAVAYYGSKVKFSTGGLDTLPDVPTYDAITSIMVLQFIPDYQKAIRQLTSALRPGGLLLLAVFNPMFISDWIEAKDPSYADFDSADNPTKGTMLFGDVAIPTFVRTAAQYNEVAMTLGLLPVFQDYPPFTQAFLKRYPVSGPTENAEHMILGYKKP